MKIKNLCNNVTRKTKETYLKVENLLKAGCLLFLSATSPLMAAAGGVTVNIAADADIGTMIGKIIDQVLTLARYVGVILLIFGIYQLYMSFKDENPDGKIKAITLLVTSVGLMTIKSIMSAIGVIS